VAKVSTAAIVGSGPNGLTAAALLARRGVDVTVIEAADRIGGGSRSAELTVPGLLHDSCAAIHPMGVASPAFEELSLQSHGLEWLWPEVDMAHPLDGMPAAWMTRSVDQTAAGLGEDGAVWSRSFGSTSRSFPDLREEILGPIVHIPKRPLRLARFGLPSLQSASRFSGRFQTERARALFGGAAAHSFSPLTEPMSAAIGVALITAGHAFGLPVAKGGSQSVVDALEACLIEAGGRVETGRRVSSIDEVEDHDIVLLDLAPAGVLRLAGERMPSRVRSAYSDYRYGPGSFKIDLAVEGGVPWRDEACRRAGTIHVGGTFGELAAAELSINRGLMPERPFVLVAQQYLADPARSKGDIHPVWAYAHVPSGYTGDATEAILDQIERFAPGLRDRVVGSFTRSTLEFPEYNENYVNGDIAVGANSARQLVFRPRVTLDPYSTGIPGVFICSQATPPGGGVHGMCGWHAARRALRHLDS
jgi:phytoene dehydrogenase-like protein